MFKPKQYNRIDLTKGKRLREKGSRLKIMTRKKYDNSSIWLKNHRIINGITERHCNSCDNWKEESLENFYYKNNKYPERGYGAECRECSVKRSQAITAKIPKDIRVKKRKISYQINKDIENNNSRKWRENNLEWKQEYQLNYQRNNPDKILMYTKNRQLHKQHKINTKEWEACLRYFNYRCAYCGLKFEDHYNMYMGKLRWENLNKEHVNHEGSNDLTNCVPSCKSCNDKKWIHLLDKWYTNNNINYTKERYDKIIKWLMEDCFQYIIEKKERKPKKDKKVV